MSLVGSAVRQRTTHCGPGRTSAPARDTAHCGPGRTGEGHSLLWPWPDRHSGQGHNAMCHWADSRCGQGHNVLCPWPDRRSGQGQNVFGPGWRREVLSQALSVHVIKRTCMQPTHAHTSRLMLERPTGSDRNIQCRMVSGAKPRIFHYAVTKVLSANAWQARPASQQLCATNKLCEAPLNPLACACC